MRNAECRMRNLKGVVVLLFFFVFAGVAAADAPSDIVIKFDHEKKVLKIEALHGSKDVKSHYVKEVWVTVNGELVANQKVKSQYDAKMGFFKFVMPDIKAGDKVEVAADCNIFGKQKKTYEVKTPPPPEAKGAKKAKPVTK